MCYTESIVAVVIIVILLIALHTKPCSICCNYPCTCYENFVSNRTYPPSKFVGIGLGSIYQDPRFEPGLADRPYKGDTSSSHGGHAGADTLGAYGSSKFQTTGGWLNAHVRGFEQPEAIFTESD